MEQLREMIGRVARSQAPVHICGESGTGKELVARLIHESGARREGPFVAVNCGAIPTELMESELFGHKRGSFTGAVADKKGSRAERRRRHLFLDEVADLPLHMQVKLLRVVQEKTVRPVGEAREETVTSAFCPPHTRTWPTSSPGPFREDLFYRINVIELRVPALRERGTTSPRSPRQSCSVWAGAPTRRRPGALRRRAATLEVYPFPGNVRELENVLERALTLSTGGVITPEHIRAASARRGSCRGGNRSGAGAPLPGTTALGSQLENIERDAIVKALEKTRYNKTAAAKLLGMSFRALRYRVKKLGIE